MPHFFVRVNGWTLVDVARQHDVTRQQIYPWQREMRRKGLWPTDAPVFLPVEMTPALMARAVTEPAEAAVEITVVLRNGRKLRCLGRLSARGRRRARSTRRRMAP